MLSSAAWCCLQRLQGRVYPELSPRDQQSGWRSSYALANMYRDGAEATGAHAGTVGGQIVWRTSVLTSCWRHGQGSFWAHFGLLPDAFSNACLL